jgi:7-carboxy-7-deazaguanine synthase
MKSVVTIPAAIPRAAEGKVSSASVSSASVTTLPRRAEVRINEIFFSLQGESSRVGLPTVFVRLTGCPLRCGYCDTAYAFHEGKTQLIADVLAEVAKHQTRYVCVTGGEPLAQKSCLNLLTQLCDSGYSVSLETSGAIDISEVDARVSRILEMEKNRWENLAFLNAKDEVKFVITSEFDYTWSKALLAEKALDKICPILFSPSFTEVSPAQLAEWILRDQLNVRMQVQLHKVIWGEKRGV